MGYQKCGPKVHRLPLSLQEFTFKRLIKVSKLVRSYASFYEACNGKACLAVVPGELWLC